MSALSPWQKKLHGHLRFSFVKSLAACGVLGLGHNYMIDHIDKQVPVADPVKREAELKSLREEFAEAEKIGKKLNLVDATLRGIYDLESTLVFLGVNVKTPPVTITYDKAALEEVRADLIRQANAVTAPAEFLLMQSPYLSNYEFVEHANRLNSYGLGSMYMGALKEPGEKYEVIPRLHDCQRYVAANKGADYNADNAGAVVQCVGQTFSIRGATLIGGIMGLLGLGLVGRTVRRDWDKAIAAEDKPETSGEPASAAPDAPPVIVSTSQRVTIKPIRIRKSVA